MTNVTELALIEKIVRAKVKLESMKRRHGASCYTQEVDDYRPCNCGADKLNADVDSILETLMFEDK